MELLGKLFGGVNRVKLMRLFVLNPEVAFTGKEAARRSRISIRRAGRELQHLKSWGLIEKKILNVLSPGRSRRGRIQGWQLDREFPFLLQLRSMLKVDLVSRKNELARSFQRCGRITFLVVAGIFLEDANSRADLLLVGDSLKRAAIDRVIRSLEADLGKELKYAVLTSADFQYRLSAHDKFVRDLLDYPHHVLVNKGAV